MGLFVIQQVDPGVTTTRHTAGIAKQLPTQR
ncbi:unnamed protein product [Mycetohabitans rhizoxinica HKI 454]|uniref:Uncharacterized protein n=1 Tax=Mycetohabitans rhizoxinica (strain DSM 19002 / CIP 109453 / HKI 454) TaxID=882378 RepID=E5AKG9_MYCRK|nr:unnamed protein product [Mycetohabitans rhizoxinica HKI 454]